MAYTDRGGGAELRPVRWSQADGATLGLVEGDAMEARASARRLDPSSATELESLEAERDVVVATAGRSSMRATATPNSPQRSPRLPTMALTLSEY